MKKMVNGKIVDIKNTDLFEVAAEGIAINRTLPNVIPNESLNIDFDTVERYISAYKRYHSSLPFPLYGVDSDLKYCAAGLFIKREVGNVPMWTSNGLFICIEKERGLALGFVNNSWGIVHPDQMKEDNIDIQTYRNSLGFEEFVWITSSLFKDESTSSYYEVFMPKFVEACQNQPLVLKWELGNILQFGNVPDRMTLQVDKIVNLDSRTEYSLDIFLAGTRPTKDMVHTWSLSSGEDAISLRPKNIKVYGYDLYMKPMPYDDDRLKPGEDKIKVTEMFGINSLFCTLCSIKTNNEHTEFDDYCGFISDDNLVFVIENRVFISKANKYVEAREVARGVDIYSYNKGIVYFVKSKMIAAGIKKEIIYSYSLVDENLRLCKIQFVRT